MQQVTTQQMYMVVCSLNWVDVIDGEKDTRLKNKIH